MSIVMSISVLLKYNTVCFIYHIHYTCTHVHAYLPDPYGSCSVSKLYFPSGMNIFNGESSFMNVVQNITIQDIIKDTKKMCFYRKNGQIASSLKICTESSSHLV